MHLGEQTVLRRVNVTSDMPPKLDVIFVHGLGGDGLTTWTRRGSNDFWPEWLAEDLPPVRVWSLTYPASATKWTTRGEGMALPDRAANLIDALRCHGVGDRPIVFICHSLGGLIVKQILRHSTELEISEWASISRSTLGVAFLATPHAGSSLATFARAFAMPRATKTILALEAHCPHLKDLGDWYRQNVRRLDIETVAYAENRKIRRGIRLLTVVNPTSANPGIEDCITISIDADHIDICKPDSRSADTYRRIEAFVRRQLRRVEPRYETTIDYLESKPTQTSVVEAPPELVRQIRELEALRALRLLDQVEVRSLKLGILNRFYGLAGP